MVIKCENIVKWWKDLGHQHFSTLDLLETRWWQWTPLYRQNLRFFFIMTNMYQVLNLCSAMKLLRQEWSCAPEIAYLSKPHKARNSDLSDTWVRTDLNRSEPGWNFVDLFYYLGDWIRPDRNVSDACSNYCPNNEILIKKNKNGLQWGKCTEK